MANIKSQIKRIKQNEVRRERNKAVRSELRTRTKNALADAATGAESAAESLRAAVARIDKAAQKGVIHPNQASRRKSRLMRHANAGIVEVVAVKTTAKKKK
jgi:small subunit ribosomal protein S20